MNLNYTNKIQVSQNIFYRYAYKEGAWMGSRYTNRGYVDAYPGYTFDGKTGRYSATGTRREITYGVGYSGGGVEISRYEFEGNGGYYNTYYSASDQSRKFVNMSVRNIKMQARYNPINAAPTVPSSISVGTPTSGKTFTVSWGESKDDDGDDIKYYLERSVNGGSYTVVRSGVTTRSYTDKPLSTWSTVAYRVRAYDGKAYSGYITSSTVTVLHDTTPPTINVITPN